MSIFWRILMERLASQGHRLLCVTPPGDKESESLLQSRGAEIINYPLNRKGLNPFQDIGSFFCLKKIFLAEKPDLVFATTIKPVIYGVLAASAAHVPAVFATITGLGYAFERDSFLKKLINRASSQLYKLSLARATGIFFQNRDDWRLFSEKGILSPEIPVLMARGTGVDTSHFSPAPFPVLDASRSVTFLFIGRLLEAKGLHEYVAAAKALRARWPRANFQILGPMEAGRGGISGDQLKEWIAEGNIEYLGAAADVRPHIANAHVAVLPSWREGTPTAIMEAMSMGRPCVVTDVPGCREVVTEGENGFLCAAHNPEALARAMEKFLARPDLIQKMGKKSRALARERFDAIKVADGIIDDMRKLSPTSIWQATEQRND